MSKEILKLKPQQLWKHFYDLTQIPPIEADSYTLCDDEQK